MKSVHIGQKFPRTQIESVHECRNDNVENVSIEIEYFEKDIKEEEKEEYFKEDITEQECREDNTDGLSLKQEYFEADTKKKENEEYFEVDIKEEYREFKTDGQWSISKKRVF